MFSPQLRPCWTAWTSWSARTRSWRRTCATWLTGATTCWPSTPASRCPSLTSPRRPRQCQTPPTTRYGLSLISQYLHHTKQNSAYFSLTYLLSVPVSWENSKNPSLLGYTDRLFQPKGQNVCWELRFIKVLTNNILTQVTWHTTRKSCFATT